MPRKEFSSSLTTPARVQGAFVGLGLSLPLLAIGIGCLVISWTIIEAIGTGELDFSQGFWRDVMGDVMGTIIDMLLPGLGAFGGVLTTLGIGAPFLFLAARKGLCPHCDSRLFMGNPFMRAKWCKLCRHRIILRNQRFVDVT